MNAFRLAPLALVSLLSITEARADEWIYRGELRDGDTPANGRYDLQLQLHGDAKANRPVGPAIEFASVTVKDGRFELPIEVPSALDAQAELWVDVSVRGTGEMKYETLPARTLAKGVAACWSTDGNAGLPGTAFLGTSDGDPLQLRSNNQRVVQYVATGASPNILAGHANNIGVGIGVNIAGGGQAAEPQLVTDNYSAIGGGYGNTAGNGNPDPADAEGATVSGGVDNVARDAYSTVGGGRNNLAEMAFSTVAGGSFNFTSGSTATIAGGGFNQAGEDASVGGGRSNDASGENATIPGGEGNRASGTGSFAAGSNAQAEHNGAFVWADTSSGFFFESTAPNQMRFRAAGGLHLQSSDESVELTDLGGSSDPIEFMAEGSDAQMYLMSGNSGTFGSVVALGEMGASLVNTWAIARETTSGGNDLRFTFGTDPVAASNPAMVEFRDDGTAFKASGSASWDVISDARLKRDIAPIQNALARLLSLRGVSFEYAAASLPDGIALPTGLQLGFLAQEVQKVFPQWIGETDDGYLFIGERGTTALLVEALRELEQRNARLEARLSELESAARETDSHR